LCWRDRHRRTRNRTEMVSLKAIGDKARKQQLDGFVLEG